MKRIVLAVEGFTYRFCEKGVSLGLLLLIAIIVIEVVSRYFFNKPTVWAMELSTMIFGAYAIVSGGYVLIYGGHVRMDLLWDKLSPKGKAIADLVTAPLSFLFIGIMVWFAIPWAWRFVEMREVSWSLWEPIVYPSKMMLVVGSSYLLLHLIVKFIRDLYTAMGKEISAND